MSGTDPQLGNGYDLISLQADRQKTVKHRGARDSAWGLPASHPPSAGDGDRKSRDLQPPVNREQNAWSVRQRQVREVGVIQRIGVGVVAIGGGATSGKDPWRLDRAVALHARQIAVAMVETGFVRETQVTFVWGPRDQRPSGVTLGTDGRALARALRSESGGHARGARAGTGELAEPGPRGALGAGVRGGGGGP